MFHGLKKLFSAERAPIPDVPPPGGMTRDDRRKVADWAVTVGLLYSEPTLPSAHGQLHEQGFMLNGKVLGKTWRIECGPPARDFIYKRELRARCEIALPDSVAVVLMNRALHTALEKQAYAMYTDSLQTVVDPKLSEEMRWLAAYPGVTWTGMPSQFFDRFAVLASKRHFAETWLGSSLTQELMSGPASQIPFMLMLIRGKCYLRMQYAAADVSVVKHAVDIFVAACDAALTQTFERSEDDEGSEDDVSLSHGP